MRRTDEYESDSWDDDVPVPHRPRKSTSRTVWIILGIVGGCTLLALLGCGGLFFWLFQTITKETPAAQASAEAFFADLQQKRIDAAYARTTPEFQRGMSKEQFQAFVTAFPALITHTSRALSLRSLHFRNRTGRAVYAVNLVSPGGQISCTLSLLKEGAEWEVNQISVP